jgi:hypothetical protein
LALARIVNDADVGRPLHFAAAAKGP